MHVPRYQKPDNDGRTEEQAHILSWWEILRSSPGFLSVKARKPLSRLDTRHLHISPTLHVLCVLRVRVYPELGRELAPHLMRGAVKDLGLLIVRPCCWVCDADVPSSHSRLAHPRVRVQAYLLFDRLRHGAQLGDHLVGQLQADRRQIPVQFLRAS